MVRCLVLASVHTVTTLTHERESDCCNGDDFESLNKRTQGMVRDPFAVIALLAIGQTVHVPRGKHAAEVLVWEIP